MLRRLADLLICPACLPEETALSCHVDERRDEDVVRGALDCPRCGARYPISEGIAALLPAGDEGTGVPLSKYETPAVLASYLWSHYADLCGDPDAHRAYGAWADLIETRSGWALDAGCAVGRFAFELSRKSDFVVGLDTSVAFIKAARQLVRGRGLETEIPEEGRLTAPFRIDPPPDLDPGRVDFIVGDAMALPFPSGRFSILSSLNIVDKVPRPMVHLREMDRVAAKHGAQFLISDPFSWSEDVAAETDWLGGTLRGPLPGRGAHNIACLLEGGKAPMTGPWEIQKRGSVWWRIRNHRNHFELIRSCYVKARR
jgi:SAM-dependent methyltransferase